MTCEEFAAGCNRGLSGNGRAERAMLVAHARSCTNCFAVIMRTIDRMSPDELTATARTVAPLIDSDNNDPEYRAVVHGDGT